ncbi:acyl carrier protein [Streptomyces sp. TBY4]|uniref:acyl carrier protein n=1 Tax=Streptomyces sp. TBY4 TaxID=2962030 RepID=UPI0020B6EB0D|nr:acyl carrier protein [Streptomyces sp. TBY4]MCP3759130.1 acyl carrier protein [Streptomyces sp. TBY4]
MPTIEDRAKTVIAEQLNVPVEEITSEKRFIEDLGASSPANSHDGTDRMVAIIMALEEEFETEIPDAEASRIVTLQSAIDYINSRKA